MKDSEEQANHTHYNQIAGQNVERLAAISDGIFAVAMTLLVLDLHDPARELIHNEGGSLARPFDDVSSVRHLSHEFSHPCDLLERSASGIEPLRTS